MIIKTIGSKLLFQSGLYILLYRLSVLGMVLSPFLFALFPGLKERNDFQEPSLRTKLHALGASQGTGPFELAEAHEGTTLHRLRGAIRGECLLIAIMAADPNNTQFYEQFAGRLLGSLQQTDSLVLKDVLVLQYRRVEELSRWLDRYVGEDTGGSYGPIRAALNLDLVPQGSAAFLKSFGNNGRISDTD